MSQVLVIMGSQSDWQTMKQTCDMLRQFGISFEARIVSAHRTPDRAHDVGKDAESKGFEVIIAGAGGAAHLAGVIAALTILPVIGVPIKSAALSGLDSLYSIVQMPGGIPVATMAIGDAGAKNAGILAAQMLALHDRDVRGRLRAYKQKLAADVAEYPVDEPVAAKS